jgi:hypothetical protein
MLQSDDSSQAPSEERPQDETPPAGETGEADGDDDFPIEGPGGPMDTDGRVQTGNPPPQPLR